MKLARNEYLKYKQAISSRLDDFNKLKYFKNDREKFDSIGKQIEARDHNHNHLHYLDLYDRYVRYIESDLDKDKNNFSKLLNIVDECFNKEVSDSFISLLKSQLDRLVTREESNITHSLSEYVVARNNYEMMVYWKAIELINKNIDNDFKKLSQSLTSVFVFNSIKYIITNIVLVGANGSGKSRFSRQIARSNGLNLPINIIPAQHMLCYEEFNSMENNDFSQIIRNYDSQEKIGFSGFHEIQYDFTNLVKLLQADYNRYARFEHKKDCLFYKVSRIFEELVKSRKLAFDDNDNMPRASTLDDKSYSINDMSDGEKTILYFIIHVLNAKPNSFIVIDEPENHLHYDACISLWNKLEKERKDCTFLYLSHNIDFVLSRDKATYIWNKNFTYPDRWEIEIIDNKDLPKRVYLEILGTVPPILYCEGEYDSLDKQLYSVVFPDFLVKECGGCNVVRQYKISIEKLNLAKNKEIYAVVDRDLKSDKEISVGYSKHGINVLKVLEVENLFFVPEVASIVFGDRYEEFKREYFILCNRQKNYMINRKLKDVLHDKLDEIGSNSFIEEYESDEGVRLSLKNVRKEKNKIESEFEKIINEQDYEKALTKFDLKNDLFTLANRFVESFKDSVLDLLRNSDQLRRLISKKYIGINLA